MTFDKLNVIVFGLRPHTITANVVTGLDEYLLIIIHQSMLYEPFSNLIGLLLLYYDFIFHWFTFYDSFKFFILHRFNFYGGFDWFVSSLWSTAVLQFFTSSDAAYGFIKLQFEKFTQTVAETVLTVLLLSYLSSLFTSSSFIDFRPTSKKCISWRMLTKFQQGRRLRSRVGQSFAIK